MNQREIVLQLLENSSYEGVELFLSKLEPPELFQLSKSIPLLRDYLNGPGIFKSLYEIRAKIPNPVSAIEQDMIVYFGEKSAINYWKLWLCAWNALEYDYTQIVLENGSVIFNMMNGWYEDSPHREIFELHVNKDNFPDQQWNYLYPQQDVVYHPMSRYYQMYITAALKLLFGLDQVTGDFEPSHLENEWYEVGTWGIGKNDGTDGDPLLLGHPMLFPANFIKEFNQEVEFAEHKKLTPAQFHEKYMNDEFDSLVYVFDVFNRALISMYMLSMFRTAFLKVSPNDFGVNEIKSCVMCEGLAYFQDKEQKTFFCGKECALKFT